MPCKTKLPHLLLKKGAPEKGCKKGNPRKSHLKHVFINKNWNYNVLEMALETLHFVQGLSRTHLLFVPRYLTTRSPKHVCQNKTSRKSKFWKYGKAEKLVQKPMWQLRGFWQDRNKRGNGAQLYGPRVCCFLSHRIIKSLIVMISGKF